MGSRSIPDRIKREIWAMPCAVCGLSGLTHVDHIIPVANGGGRERQNLQPLCLQCNTKKSNRLTNDELWAWVDSRWEEHVLMHEYHLAMRHVWPAFDRPSFRSWCDRKGVLCA